MRWVAQDLAFAESEIALYTRFLLQAETPQDRDNHGETVVKLR